MMELRSLASMRITNNNLVLADCLDILKLWYKDGKSGFIDLIYIDPPYNSKRNYNIPFDTPFATPETAFKDVWFGVNYMDLLDDMQSIYPKFLNFYNSLKELNVSDSHMSYLINMAARCWYMHHTMKDTGTFYYHCDPNMSHYIKIMLDFIFNSSKGFKNEIIWCYAGGGVPSNDFARKHDVIFRYTKSDEYTFNRIYKPYSKITAAVGRHSTTSGSRPLNEKGTPLNDWWDDIRPLINRNNEKLGYPTQKPEALLKRIIEASSNEGDLVADFYLGGGTTTSVAEKFNRRWVGTDINFRAIQISSNRLEQMGKVLGEDYIIAGLPKSSSELRQLVDNDTITKLKFQDSILKYYMTGVVANEKKSGDGSVDGWFAFKYDGERYIGIIQVTAGSNYNHLKAFCSEVGKGTGQIGVYIAFEDKITNGMRLVAKEYGKFGRVDKVQILTVEDIIDRYKNISLPTATDRNVNDISEYIKDVDEMEVVDFDKDGLQEKIF